MPLLQLALQPPTEPRGERCGLAVSVISPTLAQEGAAQPPSAQRDAKSAGASRNPAAPGPNDLFAANAAAIIEQVIAWLRERDGKLPDAADVVTALNASTVRLHQRGQCPEATALARFALAHAEQVLTAEHPQTLSSVNNLAALYQDQGHYEEAEPLYRRAIAASERVLGAEHPDTLVSVNNLAFFYHAQGRFAEAEPLLQRALAALYQDQGHYGEAEPLFRRALVAREYVLGAEHPDTLSSVNNLAALYQDQGRYGEAEPLYHRVLVAREGNLGAEHLDTLVAVNNLATLYQDQGRYGDAEPLFRRALTGLERAKGAEHPDTLRSVNNLAGLYREQGRYGEAEPLFRWALTGFERAKGAEHPDTLRSVNNLAGLYRAQDRDGEAEPLFRRALAGFERALREVHPDTIAVQLNLAWLLISQQRVDAALRELRILDKRMRRLLSQELASTEQESVRLQRLDAELRLQDTVFTLALAHPDNVDARRLAADVLLRWKRLALDEEAVIARLARTSQDPEVVALVEQLRASRRAVSRLVHLPRTDLTEAARASLNTDLAAEQQRLGALEVKLATRSDFFRNLRAAREVEWQAVQAALPPGSALLELRGYRRVDFNRQTFGEDRWLAMLIPKMPPVHWVEDSGVPALRLWDLGSVEESDEEFTQPRAGATHDPTVALYQTLFGPIDAEIARFETLYLAPDGFLDLVAFARLRVPAPEGSADSAGTRYWIERQALRVVRAGRDLLPTTSPEDAAGMLVAGGIDYERFFDAAQPRAVGQTPPAPLSEEATSPPAVPDPKPLRAAVNARLRAELGVFRQLKHTGLEAQEVSNYYGEDSQGGKAVVVAGVEAAEARLKQLGQAPRVLHLATHGFFLPNPPSAQGNDRALSLSWLALAGANLGLRGQTGPDGEDGILYALEALDLNLEGTELVTLSACDTGQGRVDASEGVYGLVRAFQIAGTRNVLMTQWALDDPAARAFMVDFYRRWLQPGAFDQPAEALRATQLEWIRSEDPVKADPQFWAPYVLVERG